MSRVYIVDAKRSPIGKFMGSISELSPAELASQVIEGLLDKYSIDRSDIDEVIIGNILSAGHGQNIARQASILSNIPNTVPAYTLNMLCGSGMKSVMNAYSSIKAGESDIIIAGGVEVMSRACFIIGSDIRHGRKMGNLEMKDSILTDGLTDYFNNYHMGITAENIAKMHNISRNEQDMFAIKSQEKAIKAIDNSRFKDEIVPIIIKNKNENIVFDTDEYPNRNTNYDKISKLKPVFKKDGTVTAGNSSGINDGASAMIIVSEKILKKYDLKPMAEIISVAQSGNDPAVMGLGPVKSIEKAIKKSKLTMNNIDILELNEAFAAQSLGVIKELKDIYNLDEDWFESRLNLNGGAIALGHPLGASGARILTTLIYEMNKQNFKYGLASLCIGGGMGTSIIVKNCNLD